MYGYEADISIPTQIGKSDKWTDIYTGFGHACGIENGNLLCWGSNSFGQLGNGKAWELTPVEVVEP
jgi:alpha-tubulin suppressor-like RCC1 family protein